MGSNHNLVISASAAALLVGAMVSCIFYVYRRKKYRRRNDYRSGTLGDLISIMLLIKLMKDSTNKIK